MVAWRKHREQTYSEGGHRVSDEPTYLDCAATTPVDPRVSDVVLRFMAEEFGNAGSRTHDFGTRAQAAVAEARQLVATVVDADPAEIVFTSGATEANNLAVLGLEAHGRATGRMHIVTSAIEHKAVLEPVEALEKRGFEVDVVAPDASGAVRASDVLARTRNDTLLVSVMQVNNETGVRQPIDVIADSLRDSDAFLHTDAAQGFAKVDNLRHPRLDLISVSGHKLFAPKGIGALVIRRRGRRRVPLEPIMHGGGQERGLRPGTLPVAMIAGLGLAAQLAQGEAASRASRCLEFRRELLRALEPLGFEVNGDPTLCVPHILNVSIPGVDSEAAMLALRAVVAVSNGSACTSARYEPSHVLRAMGLSEDRCRGAIRFSWSHATERPHFEDVTHRLYQLL